MCAGLSAGRSRALWSPVAGVPPAGPPTGACADPRLGVRRAHHVGPLYFREMQKRNGLASFQREAALGVNGGHVYFRRGGSTRNGSAGRSRQVATGSTGRRLVRPGHRFEALLILIECNRVYSARRLNWSRGAAKGERCGTSNWGRLGRRVVEEVKAGGMDLIEITQRGDAH